MKTTIRILLISIMFSLLVWILDAILDYSLFYNGTFLELLITDIPRHEAYIRILILVCFIIFGIISAIILRKQRQAQEEVMVTNAFLDTVIDKNPFAMWILDHKGTVIRTNNSLLKTINLKEDQVIGKYNVLKDRNLDKQGVMPEIRRVFENHESIRFAIYWKAANAGDIEFNGARDMYIDVSMFPIINPEGELSNVVCQWVEVTEQKLVETELKELKENLENQVKEKTRELNEKVTELESFYDAAVEREFRMEEMRKEISALKTKKK